MTRSVTYSKINSIEYEWVVVSGKTLGERIAYVADKRWSAVLNPSRYKLSCTPAGVDPNGSNAMPIINWFVFEQAHALVKEANRPGQS